MSAHDGNASKLEHGSSSPPDNLLGRDEAELARMGYKQELKSVWIASTDK